MLRRNALAIAVTSLLLGCGPQGPTIASFEVTGELRSIPGAVSVQEAVRLLTETTLACSNVEPRLGLSQWVCQVDNSGGSDRATYTVILLADGEDLRLIDATVSALPDAGPVDGFQGFFIDTVVRRLTPALGSDGTVRSWVGTHVESAGTTEIAGTRLSMRMTGLTVELEMTGAP